MGTLRTCKVFALHSTVRHFFLCLTVLLFALCCKL
uniref:Uncharacterized protein n=1 Tax=Arundo donax TaxID=35708 RepID=A0A0A9EX23_ARUDO